MTLLEYLPKVYHLSRHKLTKGATVMSNGNVPVLPMTGSPLVSVRFFYKKDLGKLLVLQVFSRLNFVLLNLLLVFTILVVLIILIEIAQIGKIA